MKEDSAHVVVVGASLGGLKVVECLRSEGFSGSITLIGDEPHVPYDRPPLSKKVIFEDEAAVEDIALRELPWEPLDIHRVLDQRVVAIDTDRQTVTTDDDESYSYDGLFLATGVEPTELPEQPEAENIITIRRFEDSLRLRKELKSARKVAVIGGGFIGCEVAAACKTKGLDVSIVEAGEVLMQRGLSRRWGAHMIDVHRSHGVEVLTESMVESFNLSDGRAESINLHHGETLEADVFIVGVGARPDTDWIERAGIACDDGVICNAYCESSVDGVYAVGDVARWHHQDFGHTIRVEHWTNADEMAKSAARNFLAKAEDRVPFTPVPMVWSDQYELKIQVTGEIADVEVHDEYENYEESIHFGEVEDGEFLVIQRDADQIRGVLSLNRAAMLVRIKMGMEKRAPARKIMQFVAKQEQRFARSQK